MDNNGRAGFQRIKALQRDHGKAFHLVPLDPQTNEPQPLAICGIGYDEARLGDGAHPSGWLHRRFFERDADGLIDEQRMCERCLIVVGAMWSKRVEQEKALQAVRARHAQWAKNHF